MNYRERYKAIRRIHRNKPKRYRLMIAQARSKASKAIEVLFPTPIPGGLVFNECLSTWNAFRRYCSRYT